MESTTKELLKQLRKVGSEYEKEKSHFKFLSNYKENHTISKGFVKDCNVTSGDRNFIQLCQSFQDEASWTIQDTVKKWHELKMIQLKKEFNKVKSRLFLHAKDRAGKLYMKVKEEMNRLSKKLNKVKEKKSMRTEKIYDPKETMTEIVSDNKVNMRINRKQHRRGKKRKNRYKHNQKKRKRRQKNLLRKVKNG